MTKREVVNHLALALECEDDLELRRRVDLLYKLLTKRPKALRTPQVHYKIKKDSLGTDLIEINLHRRHAKKVEEIFYEWFDRKISKDSSLYGEWKIAKQQPFVGWVPVSDPKEIKPRRISPHIFSFTFVRLSKQEKPLKSKEQRKKDKEQAKQAAPLTLGQVSSRVDRLDQNEAETLLKKLAAKHGIQL